MDLKMAFGSDDMAPSQNEPALLPSRAPGGGNPRERSAGASEALFELPDLLLQGFQLGPEGRVFCRLAVINRRPARRRARRRARPIPGRSG